MPRVAGSRTLAFRDLVGSESRVARSAPRSPLPLSVTSRIMHSDALFAPRRRSVSPVAGGILALAYPAALVAVALAVGFRRGGDMGEFAATVVGTLLFLIAAPTAWVLSFDFIDVTRFTVLVFGTLTSLPLWYVLGVAIARGCEQWLPWVRRYLTLCVAWTALNVLVIGVVAAIAG